MKRIQKTSKPLVLAFIAAALAWGCYQEPSQSTLDFDSHSSIALKGTIEQGTVLSETNSSYIIKTNIRAQLKFTVGQLNGTDAGPDLSSLIINIKRIEETGEKYLVHYQASMDISWPKEVPYPTSYELILPEAGDFNGLFDYYFAYGNDEDSGLKCMDSSAHDVSVHSFWYYYRPKKYSCPLATGENPKAIRLPVFLEYSDQNTSGKYPEYGKIWEDDKLEATVIFAKNKANSTSDHDAGVLSYISFYSDLINLLGQPLSSNLSFGESPGISHPELRLEFLLNGRIVDVHVFLVNGIQLVSSEFIQKFNNRSMTSDYISYNGHSGFGANIRALARMGQFIPGQYQIFLINGCDTYAYLDDSLALAHQKVNPGSGKYKYIDIITNAMPSYFFYNSSSNIAVLDGLVGEQKTYREILANFSITQRPGVVGEEDNNWPEDF